MPTARDIIVDRLSDLESEIGTSAKTFTDIHDAFNAAIEDLSDAFGWHPIERADECGIRTVPDGMKWGPRVIVLIQGQNVKTPRPFVAYYDPDTDAAHPAPYWRTVHMTAGWSRSNQPTHFLRPYA
jgi:hypothetical protein